MQPVICKHLVDEVEWILLCEPAEQVVIEHQAFLHRPTSFPHLTRPEHGRLGNRVTFPDLQHAAKALECARMLDAGEIAVFLNETASPQHDMASACRVNLARHA